MIGVLATLFQLGYSLMFLVVGVAGVFVAPRELTTVFGVDAAWLATPAAATFINQYRFLKATEAGFALFCLGHRRDILEGGVSSLIFLNGCALSIFARCWSWGVDGRPSMAFIAFLVLEIMTFLLVWLHATRDRG
jgi:hypothetical protein